MTQRLGGLAPPKPPRKLRLCLPRRLAKYNIKAALQSAQVRLFVVGICTKKSDIQQHILNFTTLLNQV